MFDCLWGFCWWWFVFFFCARNINFWREKMQLFHQLLNFLNPSPLLHKAFISYAIPSVLCSHLGQCGPQCQAASLHHLIQNRAAVTADLHSYTRIHNSTHREAIKYSVIYTEQPWRGGSGGGGKGAVEERNPIPKEHGGRKPPAKFVNRVHDTFVLLAFSSASV